VVLEMRMYLNRRSSEIKDAVAVGPEDVFDLLGRQLARVAL